VRLYSCTASCKERRDAVWLTSMVPCRAMPRSRQEGGSLPDLSGSCVSRSILRADLISPTDKLGSEESPTSWSTGSRRRLCATLGIDGA